MKKPNQHPTSSLPLSFLSYVSFLEYEDGFRPMSRTTKTFWANMARHGKIATYYEGKTRMVSSKEMDRLSRWFPYHNTNRTKNLRKARIVWDSLF